MSAGVKSTTSFALESSDTSSQLKTDASDDTTAGSLHRLHVTIRSVGRHFGTCVRHRSVTLLPRATRLASVNRAFSRVNLPSIHRTASTVTGLFMRLAARSIGILD